jgi:hypothetical protein
MTSRRLAILVVLSVAAGVAAFFLVPKPLPALSQEELIAEVKSGNVHEVVIIDGEVLIATSSNRGEFRVVLRRSDHSLIDKLSSMGVQVKYESSSLGV